jgi:hypothetical protein
MLTCCSVVMMASCYGAFPRCLVQCLAVATVRPVLVRLLQSRLFVCLSTMNLPPSKDWRHFEGIHWKAYPPHSTGDNNRCNKWIIPGYCLFPACSSRITFSFPSTVVIPSYMTYTLRHFERFFSFLVEFQVSWVLYVVQVHLERVHSDVTSSRNKRPLRSVIVNRWNEDISRVKRFRRVSLTTSPPSFSWLSKK